MAFVSVDSTSIWNSIEGWPKAVYTIEGRRNADRPLRELNDGEGREIRKDEIYPPRSDPTPEDRDKSLVTGHVPEKFTHREDYPSGL